MHGTMCSREQVVMQLIEFERTDNASGSSRTSSQTDRWQAECTLYLYAQMTCESRGASDYTLHRVRLRSLLTQGASPHSDH